ncbi:MAG: phage recombination protein Bet [Clostridium botulinum]|uniref:phage recombination protein Bet n=1 Tax=Clostridium sporogenes TaxID=1509 RepID=UPI001C60951C|nr:phage recombination protein Bet [Clostridium sporogenes]MBW5456578.1 phage recombination protein Bet [Clostridium sporogenes]MDU2834265.1 phage recombination protein Bet [Clostridium botulinum]
MAENKNSAVALLEKEMVYNVGEEEVKLTGSIVKNYLARGNKQITNREVVIFMNLCKYRKLNPFLNEAYLVKFGEEAQIVTGKEALMRKAEENPRYKGHRAGIIAVREKEIKELEGCFKLQTDMLVGGWAEVFVEGKDHPIVAKVSLQEYSKNQSTWKSMPSTMIRKVALVQALREAFPTEIGAMYSNEELGVDESKIVNIQHEVKEEIKEEANQEVIDIEETESPEEETPVVEAEIIKPENNEEETPY